ncbi:MAG: heme ABC transporter ATP-binding protein [Piscirickettsiaceae bacterium CG_4_9_14_3_um_filter_43_564]|nr:heme ABC transporter ATP-binding protein [Thiomicrospira sp.]PIQ02939.1 MAG: heme ABC transporter ATP-binding protein [Piscirickettsiaceae bacterium CG18_big_fil_WC_8_21_14_2_50_44_103]PIU38970.1 MAG: heme ABC transporter ATP-binding protein [Piscirickettsiaceae bacterium CG07_land_8_20_14_0_80_44_28]PIW57491.1 MAG: heme ABC transporter ATP-binding protein [Piscirickettsiaceae bacterium CG12_big_fil_rev_8_21_14_0_65_44_934]PIW78286.1 MAG: heme ABC transporter ATP-binding protein [Pisciricket
MLRTHHLSIKLNHQPILTDLNLTFSPGKLTILLGPNGAGKTTLLKSLSGDLPEADSQVSLAENLLETFSSEDLAKHRAVMPQSIQLDFPFRVAEVVEMGLIHQFSALNRPSKVMEALSWFDMTALAQRNYLTLSGGEQQRVQLARVFAQIGFQTELDSRYLLLDECTAHLDLAHQHQVFKLLKNWVKERRISAIMVLHDLNLASQYADELVLMHQGKLVCQGSVQQVLTEQRIAQVYGIDVTIHRHVNAWPMVVPN